jgi:protein O-GlcNAc transferase
MGQFTIQEAVDLAVQHHRAGRLREAEQLYRQVLGQQPEHVDAMHLLGVIAHQAGHNDTAADLIRRAIALRPNFPEACSNLGIALKDKGQLDESIAAFRQAIADRPDYTEAHYNLGIALKDKGQLDEAITAFRRAIALRPNYAEAHNDLGIALKDKGQVDEAIATLRRAIALRPNYAEANNNLGSALRDGGQFDKAIAAYHEAIALDPKFPEAHYNLGIALRDEGQFDKAIAAYQRAIALNPNFPEAHNDLGNALKDKGQLDEAIAAYRRAIALDPDNASIDSNLVYTFHLHPAYDTQAIVEEHRRWNRQHAQPLRKFIRPHNNNGDLDRRLRIGYVSADFRNHSVSWFLLALFRQHDHGGFEIICYSDVSNCDGVTDRLRTCADGWRNIVGWSDERVADKVRDDKIDILVDLAGHTAGNRLRVFARKPAPVQASYLGYPGTTGLSEMEYRFTDSLADPPGKTESLHTEKLWRLPVCNWCFSEPDDGPPVGPLPAEIGGSICFGTFNNFAKASPAIMELWAAILNAMPSSRLIIKSRGLGEQSVRERINRYFALRGVQVDRLEIRGHEPNIASHLGAYNQMDIALDTFPYHGTTTTCEALWMGVPVISLVGQTHVSRVGVSLLSCVGLKELIAQSAEEYVSIAVGLAKDLPRLAELRRTLRSRMHASPLMDAPRFARDIETAYRQMWRNWCAK